MIARYTEGKSDLEWQAAPFQPPGNEIAQSLLDGIEHYILQVQHDNNRGDRDR